MLDFSFSPEQESFVRTLREFVRREVAPKYAHWDRTEEFPLDLWKKMARLGLTGLRVSSECGGQEADCVTAGLAAEEVARGDFNAAYAVLLTSLVGEMLEKVGTERVRREWLRPMVEVEKIVGISLTEPHCGSDAAALRATARREGDHYLLNGEKSATTLMMAADAMIVFAKTDPQAGARGVSAFLVPTNLPGVSRQAYKDMGGKSIVRGSLFLDEVQVPADYLLGNEGEGFRQVMHAFDYSRIIIALMTLGAAEASLDETIRYVKERSAFGRPLARFEGVSFPIVEHHTMVEAVRWLCYRGLWLRDQGLDHTKEAAMVKWLGPKTAVDTIHDCLLLHGHYGYTQEFPFEQRLRDVIGLEIGDGTAQIQKLIIARELMGRDSLPY